MKKNIFTAMLLGLLAAAGAQTQNTLIMKPGADCGIDANVATNNTASLNWQTTNFGGQAELRAITWTWVASGGSQGTWRGLIDFSDLDLIPTGATVVSATLRLYGLPSTSGFGPANSGTNSGWVQRITATWAENSVTWNTQPTVTTTNQTAIPASTSTWNYDVALNVTSLVQDMVNLSAANRFGFMVRLQTEGTYRSLVFASSDNADPTLWPELEVVYTYSCALPRPPASDDTPMADVVDVSQTARDLQVYPNPGTGLVYLNFNTGMAAKAVVQVSDARGRTLKQANITTQEGINRRELDLSGLPAGTYDVSIRFADPATEPMQAKVVVR